MPPDPSVTQIIQWLSSLGGFGVLSVVCYLWFTGKLVTRRELDMALSEKDFWRDTALRSLSNTERATAAADKAASVAQQAVTK